MLALGDSVVQGQEEWVCSTLKSYRELSLERSNTVRLLSSGKGIPFVRKDLGGKMSFGLKVMLGDNCY